MKYHKKVSICMIVKNEEKNLERSLPTILPIINSGLGELIIVDTGSIDETVMVAKKFTDKVFIHPWTNNFAEMRNISLSYASGEWIWIMDADEAIEDPEKMIKLFRSNLSKYNSITIKMKNYTQLEQDGNGEPPYNTSILLRGFRNFKDFKYEGAIHEQPNYKSPTYNSDIVLRHYGYIWENPDFTRKKFERTTGLLRRELEKNPNNIYFQFQLAVSTAIINLKDGLNEMRKTHKLISKLPKGEVYKYLYTYGVYAKIAYANKKYGEIIDICKEGLAVSKDYIDLWYFMGLAYAAINDDENCLKTFKEFLKCKERFHKTTLSKDPAYTFYCLEDSSEESAIYNISVIYLKRMEYENALRYVSKLKPSESKSNLIVNMLVEDSTYHVFKDYFAEIIHNKNIKDNFISLIEKQRLSKQKKLWIAKDIIEIYELNNMEDEYLLLNLIRVKISENESVDKDLIDKILRMDFNRLSSFYGDIIAYIIIHQIDIKVFAHIGELNNIVKFMKYVLDKYENIHLDIANYLNRYESILDSTTLRYWVSLANHLLLAEKLDDKLYNDIFTKYVEKGINYVNQLYTPLVLEDECLYDVIKGEHRFFIYLGKAKEVKEKDTVAYVKYLRKALHQYPMRKGIEFLLKEVEIKNVKTESKHLDNEFEEYKKKIKENISVLINQNKIGEAKHLVGQYENIVKDDIEVISIKGVIAIIEGDMSAAEKILLNGLSLDKHNFDLLYNLAYLYEIQEKYVMAYRYYKAALELGRKDMEVELSNKLKELEQIEIVNKYKSDIQNNNI